MKRAAFFLNKSIQQRDWLGIVIFAVAVAIAVFVVSMLFSSTTRKMALRRFHLGNTDFARWATMAPVPAMYNFENRVQFSRELLRDADFEPTEEGWFSIQTNHFPARVATFGDMAVRCYEPDRQGTMELTSRYRDTRLTTRWEIRVDEDGTMQIHRVSERWDHDVQP